MGSSHMALVFCNFLLRNISQNEFTEIDTYTCGGHVPAERLWPIRGVSVSTYRVILLQTVSLRCLKMDDNEVFIQSTQSKWNLYGEVRSYAASMYTWLWIDGELLILIILLIHTNIRSKTLFQAVHVSWIVLKDAQTATIQSVSVR